MVDWKIALLPSLGLLFFSFWNLCSTFCVCFLLCLVIMVLASFCAALPKLAICSNQFSCGSWTRGEHI